MKESEDEEGEGRKGKERKDKYRVVFDETTEPSLRTPAMMRRPMTKKREGDR